MLYVLWFKRILESTSKAMLDASNKVAILKTIYPLRKVSVHHIAPALPLEEELETMGKWRYNENKSVQFNNQ
jgi:hypothetical protein